MSNIDQQFVEFIVKSLVGNPDEVKITRTIDEKGVLLQLEVAGDDLGRVIGKRGATAQSIRTLLRALGTKNDARYNLKIVDPEQPERSRPEIAKPVVEVPAEKDAAEKPETEEQVPVAEETSSEADEPEEVAAVEEDDTDEDEQEEEKEEMSYADKHRADLDDLDDLDI